MAGKELYGYKTNVRAKRFIIDLFNRLRDNKSYTMKTITTIYKNDEIFKGNLRYPIDAPYHDFYQDLTENYVVENKLDNIFFTDSGDAKEGWYFFEYSYEKEINNFRVYQRPSELDEKTVCSYIPMLHCMVTEKEIDWNDAKKKVSIIASNDSGIKDGNTTKILVIFGKDTLRTLEFSWVASFDLSTSEKNEVEKIAKKIKDDHEEEIINFTQGVLFSELDDIIIGFLQSKKQLDHTRELIKDHKHTIKNFGFSGHINALERLIKQNEFEKAKSSLKYINNLSLLIQYTTDKLYNFDVTPNRLLLREHGLTSYTKLLSFIHSATEEAETNVFYTDNGIEDHPLNAIDENDLLDVFTVLLNMYSNSRNAGDYAIYFKLINNAIEISFDNAGIMEQEYIDFYLGINVELQSKGEGLKFITNSLNKLTHIERKHTHEINRTRLCLIVNKK